MQNVMANGPMKDLIMNMCNLFNALFNNEKQEILLTSLKHASIQQFGFPKAT